MEIIHYHFTTLPSTNVYAKEQLKNFKKNALTLITASTQTQGRGQLGRPWFSPKDLNIYASFCFFISEEKEPFFFTQEMSQAVRKVLLQYEIEATLKWPNDLLVGGKKIAGILTEVLSFEKNLGVAVGLGLNVNLQENQLVNISQLATSMRIETHQEYLLQEVLDKIVEEFAKATALF